MYKCECGRNFNEPEGLGYHKKKCGDLNLDNGYEYFINNEGKPTLFIGM